MKLLAITVLLLILIANGYADSQSLALGLL
jgi:hypothetical protein